MPTVFEPEKLTMCEKDTLIKIILSLQEEVEELKKPMFYSDSRGYQFQVRVGSSYTFDNLYSLLDDSQKEWFEDPKNEDQLSKVLLHISSEIQLAVSDVLPDDDINQLVGEKVSESIQELEASGDVPPPSKPR